MRAHRSLTATTAIVALAFLALLGTGTHTVVRGETLATIAAAHGTSARTLAEANAIADPNRILVGQRLTIPGAAVAVAAPRASATYTVRSGDTLGSIAARAGTSIAALVRHNSLANPNLIRVGQALSLPGPAPAGSAPTAPAGGAQFHVVRAGDTISSVATRYGITQRQLIDANGLTGGMIYVGQRLNLVAPAPSAPAVGGTARTHVVTPGQTLSSIAQRYGTTVRAIQSANGITDPDTVVVGRRLTIPSSAGGSAGLRCPVAGPVSHVNDWGFPRSGGRFHEGHDLFAPQGTPAVAVVAGTAVQTTGRIGGLQVKLLGDDGVSYYYTHLDRFGSAGRVSAGTVVGYVGATGNAVGTSPHVHFEVHPGGGAAVNPYPLVAPVC